MKVSVIGAGYVGLVAATCFADVGNDVICFDLDQLLVDALQAGEIPIYEPGLSELVRQNAASQRLRFTSDVHETVAHGLLQFIAVGTPPNEDGSADLKHVLAAASSIAQHMSRYCVVVNKSTVPVGTGDRVRDTITEALAQRGVRTKFAVVSNPEFLKEGSAIDDFMRPDRVIIGSDDQDAIELMRRLYAPFERNRAKLLIMDVRSAEMTKYAANAMLATRVSFMNELALLAECVGADIDLVRRGIGSDPRIGSDFLYAGCGYGGSCFPKDVQALIRTGAEQGRALRVLAAVNEVNESQKRVLVERVTRALGEDLTGRVIAVWGLAFKPNTDDMREAPSIVLVQELLQRGAIVVAYDPVAMKRAMRVFGPQERLTYAKTAEEAANGADALVIVTEWKEFRSPDLQRLRHKLRRPVIIDGRNLIDPKDARSAGFQYTGIGRA